MKKLVVLLMVSLMATSAFATIDPDPDMLGVYFDPTADNNCTTAATSTPFSVFVILTSASADNVFGVEFGYDVVATPGTYFRLAEILPVGALNVGNAADPATGEYIVGFSAPAPGAGANVTCVTWTYMLLVPGPMEFWLRNSVPESIPDGLPAMEIGGTIQSLGLSTGTGAAAATVNVAECVVANEELSFGSVKSLFR